MKAKIILAIIAIAAVGVGAFFIGRSTGHNHAASETSKEGKTLYTCGMHPQVIQDHPGNCPICGMKLTPIRKQGGETAAASGTRSPTPGERKIKYYKSTMNPGEISQTPRKDSMGMDMVPVYEDEAAAAESSTISIDPVTTQNMGLRTGVVTRGPLRRVIRTVGAVDFNETALADVTTKFKGWVEKLYVDATGKQVHRGRAAVRDLFAGTVQRADRIPPRAGYNRHRRQHGIAQSQRVEQAEILRHPRRPNCRRGKDAPGEENAAYRCAH